MEYHKFPGKIFAPLLRFKCMNLTTLLFITFLLTGFATSDFKSEQKKYARVCQAYAEKEAVVKSMLNSNAISMESVQLLLISYKAEQELEVWATDNKHSTFKKIITYPVCTGSGVAGPKVKSGDLQVPEGFYHISAFNPVSSYFLSLKINYPNAADRIRSKGLNPGGDIFIHGKCVTIGCLPLTDAKIKELYVLATEARTNGQLKIPVYIFPARFDGKYYTSLLADHDSNKTMINFWNKLNEGYRLFEKTKKPLQISVNSKGIYEFQ